MLKIKRKPLSKIVLNIYGEFLGVASYIPSKTEFRHILQRRPSFHNVWVVVTICENFQLGWSFYRGKMLHIIPVQCIKYDIWCMTFNKMRMKCYLERPRCSRDINIWNFPFPHALDMSFPYLKWALDSSSSIYKCDSHVWNEMLTVHYLWN